MIQIGCVADDFTGASDWASFFAQKGVEVVLYNGIPHEQQEVLSVKFWSPPTAYYFIRSK